MCDNNCDCRPESRPPPPRNSPPPTQPLLSLKATHYWDCSGAACDSKTLNPWDPSKYRYSAYYAPLDPNSYPGGAVYGERMWMTGAASDALSDMLGRDDSCCGQDSEGKIYKFLLNP
jgi:hypothetical protein